MAVKPNKENIITEMLIELEKGISYTDCMVVNGSKWLLPSTTFTRYWKEANSRHFITQQAIQKQIVDQTTEAEKERLKIAILTKDQSLKILSDLAITAEKDSDKINSLKTLADLQGWKSPIQTESKVEISKIDLNKYTDDELRTINELQRKGGVS